jgi:hypothetical protein
MKLLVAWLSEIFSTDGDARRYTHDLAIAECSHRHLVCQECAASI